jgi:hypothetical protein
MKPLAGSTWWDDLGTSSWPKADEIRQLLVSNVGQTG